MTKQFVRKNIQQDRITTRGMKWKLEVENKTLVAYGTKTQAINKIYNLLNK
jgi:hypothetical protein